MKNLHNIEKSAFRKGQYVGYSNVGVWRIRRDGRYWWAHSNNAPHTIGSRTLADLSVKLEAIPLQPV